MVKITWNTYTDARNNKSDSDLFFNNRLWSSGPLILVFFFVGVSTLFPDAKKNTS